MKSPQQWQHLTHHLTIPQTDADTIYADLHAQYTQPSRHYHNLAHILNVLDSINQLTTTPSSELLLAAWFHDVIYNSKAQDNEAQSAALSRVSLAAYPNIDLQRIEELILATAAHEAPASDLEMQILLDADLAILGADSQTYQTYSLAIRQEYVWVEEDLYRTGRKAVLQHFLSRAQLYFTPTMQAAHEEQAKNNLMGELATLSETK